MDEEFERNLGVGPYEKRRRPLRVAKQTWRVKIRDYKEKHTQSMEREGKEVD